MKITLPLPTLTNTELQKLEFHYLDLQKEILVYRLAYKADTEVTITDYTKGEEPEIYKDKQKITQDQNVIRKKSSIVGIDVEKEEFEDISLYCVTIIFAHTPELGIYFKTTKEAHNFKNIIADYWLKDSYPHEDISFS